MRNQFKLLPQSLRLIKVLIIFSGAVIKINIFIKVYKQKKKLRSNLEHLAKNFIMTQAPSY